MLAVETWGGGARGMIFREESMTATHAPKPTYNRLPQGESHQLLSAVLERCTRNRRTSTAAVLLDLDGTLIDNRPRTCAIFHTMARDFSSDPRPKFRDVSAVLAAVTVEQLAYLASDSLKRLGIGDAEILDEMKRFWVPRFFSDEFLDHDRPHAGAVEFVKGCYEAGATVVYFTGRDLPNMGVGTFRSLRDLGFPIASPGVELVMKPNAAMSDEAFKSGVCASLARTGDVIAGFDNEPANCNVMLQTFADADVFLVDTDHVPGAPQLNASVRVIGDFKRELS